MDRQTRRNPSTWQQPSPALVPQQSQSHIATSPSPTLAPQSSSPTQVTPPNEWKSWNDVPSPPNEGSTSQKAAITLDNSKRSSPKVAESDVSSSSQTDTIPTNNNTIINNNNETVSTIVSDPINPNQINGNGESGSNWADQTHESSTNYLNESNQVNDNLNSEEGSSSTNNNDTTLQQNRNQYNNNRRNKNQLSVYVGNITPPVTEDELKEFFTSHNPDCQVSILIF